MERSATIFANTASGHTVDDFFIRNVDVDDMLNLNTHIIQSLSLRNSSWKTVKNETLLAVIGRKSFLYNTNYYFVGNKLAFIHKGFSLQAHLSAVFQRFTDHVSG